MNESDLLAFNEFGKLSVANGSFGTHFLSLKQSVWNIFYKSLIKAWTDSTELENLKRIINEYMVLRYIGGNRKNNFSSSSPPAE